MVAEKVIHFYACQMGTTNSVKQHKLRKRIAWLSGKETSGMDFISLYVPREKSIEEIVAFLKKIADSKVTKPESATDCTKSTLKNIIQHLKLGEEIPENGLAIFAGTYIPNNSEIEGLNVEEIIPPKPITAYSYIIDNRFQLEPLREMLREQKVVGLIVIDSKTASFGILNGENFELIGHITSGIPGKVRKRRVQPAAV